MAPAAAVAWLLAEGAATEPPEKPLVRRFSVWGPADLSSGYTSMEQVLAKASSLVVGSDWDETEFLIKAGEGGSWQYALSPHPLHVRGAASLAAWIEAGQRMGIRVTPYVVTRGRGSRYPTEDWTRPEQQQIAQCVKVAGRCVLNVEPSRQLYWGGPFDPEGIDGYLAGIGVPPDTLEVAAIPRQNQVNELGGGRAIAAWTNPERVGRASWECYGLLNNPPGEDSLRVDYAIGRLDRWGVPQEPQYRIPIVQRDERLEWANSEWTTAGVAIWWLDGN